MNIKNSSITAIIFVIIYFVFVFFLSSLKGLTFYNIKLNNISIKELFFKIDDKIILKANSITIIPQTKINEDILNIHKKIYNISKFISLLQKISIKNIKYKNFFISKLEFLNGHIYILSNLFEIKGEMYPYKKLTIFQNVTIDYDKFKLNIINGKIEYKNRIILKILGSFKGNVFNLNAILNNKDVITYTLKIDNLNTKIKQYTIRSNKIFLKGTTYLNNLITKLDLSIKKLIFKDLSLEKLVVNYSNKNISFKVDNGYKKGIKIKEVLLNNVSFAKLKGNFYIPSKLIIVNFKKFGFEFNNSNIILKNNDLVFQSIKNFSFQSKNILLKNRDINISSSDIKVLKLNKFLLVEAKDNIIANDIITLYSKYLYTNNEVIKIPKIIGTYKHLKISLKEILIYYLRKKSFIKSAEIGHIPFNSINIAYKNNIININLKSKALIKSEIFSYFNLKPILIKQLQGKNLFDVNLSFNINNKKFKIKSFINSIDSIYHYDAYLIYYKKLIALITDNNITANIKNLVLNSPNIKLKSDLNLSGNFKKFNLTSFIDNLNILNLIKVKNFKEDIYVDLDKNITVLKNSKIYIDLNKSKISFLSLKKIINFTPLKNIINDGYITLFFKDNIFQIVANIIFKKKIFIDKNDIINLDIVFDKVKNSLFIQNDYLKVNVKNFNNIFLSIKDTNISLENILNLYNELNLTRKDSSNSDINVTIKSKNMNIFFKNHILLSKKAIFVYHNNNFEVNSSYKKSNIHIFTKQGYLLGEANNYTKEELIYILKFFNKFKKLNLDFIFIKSPDNFYNGKIYINEGIVKELKVLNNIIAFVNTIPSLLSLSSPGFSAKGYKIKNGFLSYIFYNNILYLKQIKIIGENIDFIGKGYIDLNKNLINIKLTANLKMKLKKIPVIGKGVSYILFGKDGNINVKILVKGNLDNPKVTQDIGKSIILTPFQLFKRVITLPLNLF